MNLLDSKYELLQSFIREKGKNGVAIAFSGGVDSATLAAVSHNILGDHAIAVTAKSPTYTLEELEESKRVANEIGIKQVIVETNELMDENFSRNTEDRCYYCKKALLIRIQKVAENFGLNAIFEGTNFSDLQGHRPGFQAVKETVNAYSPLVECKITKEEIREIARKLRLSVQNKPPMPCLASRIQYNERITPEKLFRVKAAEQEVRRLTGVKLLRVRDHGGLARIEVGSNEREVLFNIEIQDRIATALKELGFKYVTIDTEGYRTGSMLLTRNSE
ncbi:MAG: ATP-dependent sacrificial sulfur transferase LarE [Candidatus Bathyarchaeia archaeon]